MTRSEFKFNPEDLNYDTLDNSLNARIWKVVIYVVAVLVMAILLNVVYSLFFDTPRERQIRRENEMLLEQYELLSERKSLVDTVMKEVQSIDKDIYRVIFETEPVETGMDPVTELTYQNLLITADEIGLMEGLQARKSWFDKASAYTFSRLLDWICILLEILSILCETSMTNPGSRRFLR